MVIDTRRNTLINSHILLPKFLLKNFEIDHFFWLYDIDGGFIGRGFASSFNTEKGYYSDATEHILNAAVEAPFSNLLKRYRSAILSNEEFGMSWDDILLTKRFFYSLLSRNPQMVRVIKSHSVYYQFLPETDQHGYAAIAGIQEAEKKDLFNDYDVAFFINQTETPFVIPNCGIYNLILRGAQTLAFPVSPVLMFALGKGMGVKGEDTVELQRGIIAEETVVKQMNMQAFRQQVSMNGGGRIICSQKEELERLKAEQSKL